MKTILLLLSLVLCVGNYANAQETTEQESPFEAIFSDSLINLHPTFSDYIIPDTPSFCWGSPPPFNGFDPNIWTGIDTWIGIDPSHYTVLFTIAPFKNCGEARYDNGMLYSRCECNADSVRHGKSAFWQQDGKISSVAYYSKGTIYTQKFYSNGKVDRLENYAYRNNEQLLHGKHIQYTENGKVLSNYHFGKKHGAETEYSDGYLYAKRRHKNGTLVEEKTFDQKGKLLSEATWNERGIPAGTWVQIHPEANATKYTTYHENGQQKEFRSMLGDVCIELQKYSENGVLIHSESNFADGSPSRYFTIDFAETNINKEWSKEGELISDWRVQQYKLVGSGFYTSGQKRTKFKQVFNADGSDILECWTFVNGDTSSFYYAHNKGSSFSYIIYENKFVQHNGKATKHGQWTQFENNQVLLEECYDHGVLDGHWKQFALVGGKHQIKMEGEYKDGMRSNLWTVNTDSCQYQVLFINDQISGKIEMYKHGMLSMGIQLNYLDPSIRQFQLYEGNTNKWICSYINEVPHGNWSEFHPNGTLKGYGTFENGKLKSKWIELVPKKNGKMKKVRLKEMDLPNPVFPIITELTIETPA